ncbi:hypothetical protein [Roseomonas marmotae]|uniref:Uncharacterized protein n=1 Tax=Roseomonas marmotae TaxID=2768161 RepID=A0ABS3KHS0_9PROT|nr:hypothetical protein [Roseomonas marmotae]MBO1077024.1 hypothetical protein [Roseomonas marmotae]QTI78422.1 hypothetical protein IAI58_12065 [Roseomonas marmotae]
MARQSDLAAALIVHDASQVAQALRVARAVLPLGRVLPLLSAPGAAHWLSPRLFLAMVAEGALGLQAPHLPVLDCGMAAGYALAALRAGCPALILSAGCPAYPALAGAAAEAGARLWGRAPAALDLALLRPGTPRAEAALRGWLTEVTAI